jgi:hypothetical protein
MSPSDKRWGDGATRLEQASLLLEQRGMAAANRWALGDFESGLRS